MNPEINISSFAFNTGRQIEEIIKITTNNLWETNKYLEAKILEFRQIIQTNGGLTDFSILEKYDEHFNIQKL